jgi:hypothetical protein
MKGKTGRLIEQYRDGAATVRIDGRIHHIPTCMLEVLSECGGVKRG